MKDHKKIILGKVHENWEDCDNPHFDDDVNTYRIKPEKEKWHDLREDPKDLPNRIKNLVNAFNNYECAMTEMEQEITWEILRDLMHEELYILEGKGK